MPRVHLIDASPYIFRAFFSLPSTLVDAEGRPANAIYGFASFLMKLINDEAATHMAVTFDRSLNTSFRNEIFADYKAQRELPDARLEAQLDRCERLAAAMGLATFSSPRFEADDLMATLLVGVEPHTRVVLVSSDKDLTQLVDSRVELLDFAKGHRLGVQEVIDKMGVRPSQVADFLGLAGDSVDNIPGVPGVGKKTASALLAAYDNLESALADLDGVAQLELRGAKSLAKKLHDHSDAARLSKRLATLSTDAPVSASLDELSIRGLDETLFKPLTAELGLDRLSSRLRAWSRTLSEKIANLAVVEASQDTESCV